MDQLNVNKTRKDEPVLSPIIYGQPTTRSEVKYATISKEGGISFSKAAVKEFNIEKFNFCMWGYDKKKNAIALKFIMNPCIGCTTVMKNSQGNIKVHRKAFFNQHNLDLNKIKDRYFIKKVSTDLDTSENWIGIYLDNPIKTKVLPKTKNYDSNGDNNGNRTIN